MVEQQGYTRKSDLGDDMDGAHLGGIRAALLLVATSLVLAGCAYSTNGKPSSPSSAASAASAQARTPAVQNYGYGAAPSGADLQPDVVVVHGGPAEIRSVSSDGLVWTINRAAPGADSLKVGSVMLLSSEATGRVVALHDSGGYRAVTLAPVQLTDIIRNGSIDLQQAIDPSAMTFQTIPDLPGDLSVPANNATLAGDSATERPLTGGTRATSVSAQAPSAGGLTVLSAPGLDLAAALAPQHAVGGVLTSGLTNGTDYSVGDWGMKVGAKAGEITLGITYGKSTTNGNETKGLQAGLDFVIKTSGLRLAEHQRIVNGQTTTSGITVEGLKAVQVAVQAGASDGSKDNAKVRIEVPIQIDEPIPPSPATAGVPLTIRVSFKFIVETAISGNNSTIGAGAEYGLSGSLGYDNGAWVTPQFSVIKSLVDSIIGVTLGPSGIVFAVSAEYMGGIGIPAAMAGPYVGFVYSLGFSKGSVLGSPLASCHGATLTISGNAGFGVAISSEAIASLKALLPANVPIKFNFQLGKTRQFVNRSVTVPSVALCGS